MKKVKTYINYLHKVANTSVYECEDLDKYPKELISKINAITAEINNHLGEIDKEIKKKLTVF